MFRLIHGMLLTLAALAPIGCATDAGIARSATDVHGDSAGVALTAARASSPEPSPETVLASAAASTVDLAALQSQAEDAYRARRFDEALTLYERLVELRPASAHAWLRLGNVHHQRRAWFKAITAYRRASARTIAGVETEPAVRAKAYYNVALIDLELARQSLRSLERLGGASAAVGDPAPLAREIDRTQRRLEAVFSRESVDTPPGADTPANAERSTKVDRPRKADAPTKVDYIRGEPRP